MPVEIWIESLSLNGKICIIKIFVASFGYSADKVVMDCVGVGLNV